MSDPYAEPGADYERDARRAAARRPLALLRGVAVDRDARPFDEPELPDLRLRLRKPPDDAA